MAKKKDKKSKKVEVEEETGTTYYEVMSVYILKAMFNLLSVIVM